MRLIGPIRRPLWMVAAVGEGVLEVALNVVREVRASLEEVAVRQPEARTPSPPRRPAPPESEPGLFDSTGRRDPPPSPAPPISDTVKTLDDEPVLVAEFGDEGPQVSVGEPWDGYDQMNVPAVKDRLAAADRELLGAVVLYEGFSKKRSSVTQAAERRLRQLSQPGSS